MSRASYATSLALVLVTVTLLAFTLPGETPRDRGDRAGRGVPLQLNHQGVVQVDGVRYNGSGYFRFALVDPDTGDYLWTNDGSAVLPPDAPTDAVELPVINGIYNVRLGDTGLANMTAIPAGAFGDDNVTLRIWFTDGVNGVQQLSPDHPLTAAPYAFHAAMADNAFGVVPVGAIIAWHRDLPGCPGLPDNFVECNGQELDDAESPFNGEIIPDLNAASGYSAGRFLRGTTGVTGQMQEATDVYNNMDLPGGGGVAIPWVSDHLVWNSDGSTTHGINVESIQSIELQYNSARSDYVRPVNMTVVWIMRVK